MELEARIYKVYEGQGLLVSAPFPDTYLLGKRGITAGRLILDDGRRISAKQRKHIYATVRDIADYTGDVPEYLKEIMKCMYIERYGGGFFSLSDCDMTTARHFLQFLIDFCIEQGIPTSESLLARAPDIGRMIYKCILLRKCCITQREGADLHHVTRVGMGNSRKKVIHEGMLAMPLLREYHSECHAMPQDEFNEKYKVFPIRLDKTLCTALGLNMEAS